MSRSADVKLLDDFHSLVEKCKLLLLDLLENRNSALRVNKLHAVHFIKEGFNRVLLLQLLEPDYRLLPIVVMRLKLHFVLSHHFLIEGITLDMLLRVLYFITFLEINHDLVNRRLKFERNVDQLLSQFVKESRTTFKLELL